MEVERGGSPPQGRQGLLARESEKSWGIWGQFRGKKEEGGGEELQIMVPGGLEAGGWQRAWPGLPVCSGVYLRARELSDTLLYVWPTFSEVSLSHTHTHTQRIQCEWTAFVLINPVWGCILYLS